MGQLPKHGEVTVDSTAPPEAVWQVLTDVTRTGEWSHETVGAAWLDGVTVLERLFYALIPAHRDRSRALQDDLVRLAAVAEGAVAAAPGQPPREM